MPLDLYCNWLTLLEPVQHVYIMAAILATIAIKAQRHNNCLRKFAYNKIGRLRSKETRSTHSVCLFCCCTILCCGTTPTHSAAHSRQFINEALLMATRVPWDSRGLLFLAWPITNYNAASGCVYTCLPLFVFSSSVCLSTLHLSVPLSHCLVSGVNVAMGSQYHPKLNCFPI